MRFFIILFLLAGTYNTKSQTSTVKGVITYYFNENQGNKPDLGAKAYLIDETKASFLNMKTVDSFSYAKNYLGSYKQYQEMALGYESLIKKYKGKNRYKAEYEEVKKKYDEITKSREECFEKLKIYGVETEQKFDSLDKRVTKMLLNINNYNSPMTTIDATGSYSFTTKPGNYYVYIISKNRTGESVTEVMGQIYFTKITLRENEVKDVSTNFDLY